MSKYVKNLISEEVARRLDGVQDALLVDVIGLDSAATYNLRKKLREKRINLLVVKTSLAARALKDTSLAPAFEGADGSVALCWGSEDFISLAKEIVEIQKEKDFEKFASRGGVMDGERLTPERVAEISKWPNRGQQLSILVGQILSVGAQLSSQLIGPSGALASQIEKKSKEEGAS
jgi:ribosomal protein L10